MTRPKSKRPWSEVLEVAPGPLALVQAFLNTDDGLRRLDELATGDALTGWLRHRQLVDDGYIADAAAAQRAREVREALRTVLRARRAGRLAEEATLRLDREAQQTEVRVRFAPDGDTRFEAVSDDLTGVFGQIFAAYSRGPDAGTLDRLKICDNPRCRRAYYDRSPGGSSRWCSMAICGNRAKARTRRQRRGPSPR